MRAIAFAFASIAFVALASVHCGGRVDGETAADCPATMSGACSTGAQCLQHYSDCGGAHTLTCSCESGSWQCPQLGPPNCKSDCSLVKPNGACTQEGAVCSYVSKACGESTSTEPCTCQGGHFVCASTICPPLKCPAPASIHDGAACSGSATCPGILACPNGTSVGQNFDCINGRWVMWESFADPCMSEVDAGSADGG